MPSVASSSGSVLSVRNTNWSEKSCSATFLGAVLSKEARNLRFPNKEAVEHIRKRSPVGCRAKLLQMGDVQDVDDSVPYNDSILRPSFLTART